VLSTAKSFFLLSFLQPHSRPTAVLIDELDACRFECATNRLEGRAARLACTGFQLMDGHYPHLSAVSQFLLIPFQQAARCSAL
jgi:hypothetical protein